MAEPRPVVAELFTSQGCDSCPPAEKLLGELSGRSDVIALAFHVNYWDYLGWRDPFGLAEATARQKLYAKRLGLETIYTPQMVIDGKKDVEGADRAAITAEIGRPREGVALSLTHDNASLEIALASTVIAAKADLMLIAYTDKTVTTIPRGENAGRTLPQFNLVRAVIPLGTWQGAAFHQQIPLSSLPRDATHVALLLQESGQGAILGATMTSLR